MFLLFYTTNGLKRSELTCDISYLCADDATPEKKITFDKIIMMLLVWLGEPSWRLCLLVRSFEVIQSYSQTCCLNLTKRLFAAQPIHSSVAC